MKERVDKVIEYITESGITLCGKFSAIQIIEILLGEQITKDLIIQKNQ